MQTGSDRQSALQPSPPKTLPSSQDSSPSRAPSPQTVGWQATAGVGQAEPGSTRHASLQPSPGMSLPSSQVSPPITMPSPQIGIQRAPIAGQIQPGSILQSAEQPSPDVRLRSSQVSDPATRPSPQETVQVQGFPGAAQIQSVSAAVAALRVPVVTGLRGQVQLPVSTRRSGAVDARRRVAAERPLERHHVGEDIGRAVRSRVGRGVERRGPVNLGGAPAAGSGQRRHRHVDPPNGTHRDQRCPGRHAGIPNRTLV